MPFIHSPRSTTAGFSQERKNRTAAPQAKRTKTTTFMLSSSSPHDPLQQGAGGLNSTNTTHQSPQRQCRQPGRTRLSLSRHGPACIMPAVTRLASSRCQSTRDEQTFAAIPSGRYRCAARAHG